jgi:DNA-binding NarL/FixJ family response regulator
MPHLIEAVRQAATGRPVFSPDIAARIHGRMGLLVNANAGRLTPREHETLEMLAQGMRYHAIAQRLSVSDATVKFHVLNLYQKLQSTSRVEAINRARAWGLLR